MKYFINRFIPSGTSQVGGRCSPKRKSLFLRTSQGFTLIELLVVIAIIGILAAVVLASLNSARDKSKVAAIKSNLRNLQSQAELYYNDNNTYAGLCNNDNTVIHASIQPFIDALKNISGSTNVKCFVYPPEVGAFYADDAMQTRNFAVVVAFNDIHYAVDNQGVVTFDTANTGTISTWQNAQLACANVGKRLPSMEMLRAVFNIHGNPTSAGFSTHYYWSSSISPSLPAYAYSVYFGSGVIDRMNVVTSRARCVY